MEVQFDEIVLFELPRVDEAQRLCLRLQPTRLSWLDSRDETLYVAAVLGPERDDLAVLLRAVEAWLADSQIPWMDFELDGRRYALRVDMPALA